MTRSTRLARSRFRRVIRPTGRGPTPERRPLGTRTSSVPLPRGATAFCRPARSTPRPSRWWRSQSHAARGSQEGREAAHQQASAARHHGASLDELRHALAVAAVIGGLGALEWAGDLR